MGEHAKTEYTKEQLEDHIWTLRRLWPKGPGNDKAKQAILAAIRIIGEKKDDLSGQEQYK